MRASTLTLHSSQLPAFEVWSQRRTLAAFKGQAFKGGGS